MLNIGKVTKPMGKINGDTSRNNCVDTRFLSQISTFSLFLGNFVRVQVQYQSNCLIFIGAKLASIVYYHERS